MTAQESTPAGEAPDLEAGDGAPRILPDAAADRGSTTTEGSHEAAGPTNGSPAGPTNGAPTEAGATESNGSVSSGDGELEVTAGPDSATHAAPSTSAVDPGLAETLRIVLATQQALAASTERQLEILARQQTRAQEEMKTFLETVAPLIQALASPRDPRP